MPKMSKRKSNPVVDKPTKRAKTAEDNEGEDANVNGSDPEDPLSQQVIVIAMLQNICYSFLLLLLLIRSCTLLLVGSLRFLETLKKSSR